MQSNNRPLIDHNELGNWRNTRIYEPEDEQINAAQHDKTIIM